MTGPGGMSGTTEPVALGLIGLDSPHAVAFTKLLNGDGATPPAVAGGRVVSAWSGEASADFPLSRDRLEPLTESVRSLGVPIQETLEQVAKHSDALLILSVDARTHMDYFMRCAPFGKPIYVDTRFALSAADARTMLDEARRYGALPLVGSPKRFSADFRSVLTSERADGIDVSGPMPMQPTQPGLFWYGIHMVDMVVAAMGPGCVEVCAYGGSSGELIVATWGDGRTATIRGHPRWTPQTRGVVHHGATPTTFAVHAGDLMLTGLLEAIIAACDSMTPMIDPDEIAHVIAITAAANRSRDLRKAVSVNTPQP